MRQIIQIDSHKMKNKNKLQLSLDLSKTSSQKDILDYFSKELKFPSYFGNNWDALFDCLKDLMWLKNIKEIEVNIKNIDKTNSDHTVLLEILVDTVKFWESIKFNRKFKDEYIHFEVNLLI